MPTILRTLDIMTIIQPVFPPCSDPNPTLSTQQAISVTVVLGDTLVSKICQAKSPGCYLRATGPRAPVSHDHCLCSKKWWRHLFTYVQSVSTDNSFILAKQSHPEEVAQRFGGYQDFLELLAEGLIGNFGTKRDRLEKKYKKQKIPNGASSKVQRRGEG